MKRSIFTGLIALPCTLLLITACSKQPTEASVSETLASGQIQRDAVANCVAEPGLSYLCGITNGEDILHLGSTSWLLISGMNGELTNQPELSGRIHFVDPAARKFSLLFPGATPVMEQNKELFGSCPGPLDVSKFSAHGMALKAIDEANKQYRLYITSHGAREAVEVFDIDAANTPTIKWIGCVPMPITSWTNSLVILNDWGFLATQFMDPTGTGMQGVRDKKITGQVFEWHPGSTVTTVAGTELSGPNGIAMSDDERFLYVAAFGTNELVRFDRSVTPVARQNLALTIAPDNVRWVADNRLYAAGGNITDTCGGPECGTGWSVIEIDTSTMTAKRVAGADEKAALKGISSAQLVGNEIWVGTYSGDRIGIMPKQ